MRLWPRGTLSASDAAIWRTVALNQALDRGDQAGLPTVQPPFLLKTNELAFASGSFQMLDVVTRGMPGPELLRPRTARGARNFRWAVTDRGRLWVSNQGFRLEVLRGIRPWWWASINSAEMVGPGQLLMLGESTSGGVRWLLGSDWAELLFTLWARTINPRHPAYQDRSWIPPGWPQRVKRAGMDLPDPTRPTPDPEVHR